MDNKVLIKAFLIFEGAVASGILTYSLILLSLGFKDLVCFKEPIIWISIPEIIIGFCSTILLFYIGFDMLLKKTLKKTE